MKKHTEVEKESECMRGQCKSFASSLLLLCLHQRSIDFNLEAGRARHAGIEREITFLSHDDGSCQGFRKEVREELKLQNLV